MCLIAVKYQNEDLPKDADLIQANIKNSDGIGIAYWKPDKKEVYIKKDFENITNFLIWIKENIKKEDICLIHFRLATHGLKDMGNRHPFPVTKNKQLLRQTDLICQMAVVHNGVLRDYGQHVKYSDTQKFVLDILAEDNIKNNLKDKTIRKLVNNFIDGDRLAILDDEGMVYIFGEFHKKDGIYYSNKSYESYSLLPSKWDWNKIDNEPIKSNAEGFVDNCDGCNQKKFVRMVEIKGYNYYLCKSCRKKAKKGELEFICDEEEETEEIQCEGCLEVKLLKDCKELYGMVLCEKCLENVTASFNKKENR